MISIIGNQTSVAIRKSSEGFSDHIQSVHFRFENFILK